MSSNFWLQLKKPILALAPMEGVTDSPFRQTCKPFGVDVSYTEFLSADAIAYGAPKILAKMRFAEMERPIVCQIFGRDPKTFTQAAKKVQELGFDGLDINFGCPARKVVGHGAGVALLREPAYAKQLIEAAMEAIDLPVSIKVRASIRKERLEVQPGAERHTALDLVRAIEGLPVSAIMIHGRSFEQGHQGSVDTDMIRQVKQAFPGLVLANGGINTAEQAKTMLDATGADGLGIARGAWGRPWIFQEIKHALAQKTDIEAINFSEVIERHATLVEEQFGQRGIIDFRKHLAHYFHGQPGATEFRRQAVQAESLDDVRRVLAAAQP